MPRYFIFCTFFLICLRLSGQSDFRDQQDWMEDQLSVYQSWLDRSGLGAVLEVDKISVRPQRVLLVLKVDETDETKAISALNELRADFAVLNAISLEERLLLRLALTLEISTNKAEILILNRAAAGKFPALRLNIRKDKSSGEIKGEGNFRNEVPHQITLPPFRLDTTFRQLLKTEDKIASDQALHFAINQALLDSLNRHFTPRMPRDFSPVRLNESPAMLTLRNIKGEVIPPGILSFFDPHEYLGFTVDHRFTEAGLELHLIVDGKIGSGLSKIRSGNGFRDMDPEYQSELEEYVRTFTLNHLQPWLLATLKKLK